MSARRMNGLPEWYTVEAWIENSLQHGEAIEQAVQTGSHGHMDEALDTALERAGKAARIDAVLKLEPPADCIIRIAPQGLPPILLPMNPERFTRLWNDPQPELQGLKTVYLWYAPPPDPGFHPEDLLEN